MDIVLTGIPRSGITLAAELIGSFPNSLCIAEPEMHNVIAARLNGRRLALAKWVTGEFLWLRKQIERGKPVDDIIYEGLDKNFTLAIQCNALYPAILPELLEMDHFRVIAVIRNPVDTILSWQRLNDGTLEQGKLPEIAGPFWPETESLAQANVSHLIRAVQLYEIYCQRFHELRDHITIIKYEELIKDPMLLSRAIGLTTPPPGATIIRNTRAPRMAADVDPIRDGLQQYGVFAKQFYPNL